MSKSAQSVQRSAYLILGFLFIFGGGGFALFVWNDTRFPDTTTTTQEPGPPRVFIQRFSPALTLKVEESRAGAVFAVATVTNATNARLLIPDLSGIEPLYTISVKYAAAKSGELRELPRVPAMQAHMNLSGLENPVPYNSERDVAVELLPGRSHALAIPFSEWYAPKPGHYELHVTFRPTELVAAGQERDLPRFNVTGATATLNFDLPLQSEKAAAPAASKPAAKSPAAASK